MNEEEANKIATANQNLINNFYTWKSDGKNYKVVYVRATQKNNTWEVIISLKYFQTVFTKNIQAFFAEFTPV